MTKMLTTALLALALLPSCSYLADRSRDFLDQFRLATGLGTVVGLRGEALGLVDTEPSDDARARFKLSQAVWASRFEQEEGRRLRKRDNLIRDDWDQTMRAVEAAREHARRAQQERK